MSVALFVPCSIDQLYSDVADATLELLERFGVDVVYPAGQTCCGQPMANTGCFRRRTGSATTGRFIREIRPDRLSFRLLHGDRSPSLRRLLRTRRRAILACS